MSNSKWIWMYASQVKGNLSFVTLILVLEMVSNLGIIGIQKFIIDDLFVHQNFDLMVPLLSGLAALALIYNLLHLYAAMIRNKGDFKLQRLLLEDMIQYLHRIPVRLFRKQRTGRFVHHLTQDINQASTLVSGQIPNGIMEISGAIILSVVIGFASPILLLTIMGVSAGYIALGKFFAPRMKQSAKEVTEEQSQLLVMVEESIASSREVIAFHRQLWEKMRLRERYNKYFLKIMGQLKVTNQQALFSMPMIWSIRLIVLGYGGYLVISGNLSIGWFVVIFQFSSQLLTSYEKVYNFLMNLAGQMAVVERVREVMDGEKDKDGSIRLNKRVHSLQLENITFQYDADNTPVLQNINIEIPIGKKAAFVGTSGGGKSTIAQLLVRFYDPDRGQIIVNGQPLSGIQRNDWLKRISVVFQEPYLFPDTVRNNLLIGRDIPEDKMIEICKQMHIHDFIASFTDGYDTQIGERGIQLSGGQRQRIALARALLADSEILILDEATSALDLETERHVQQYLDNYRKDKTTIVIAHRLSTVIDADVIYVLDGGHIVEHGTHEELMMKQGMYSNLIFNKKQARRAPLLKHARR
jgi:ABC-type multidrug transport system fused ATPase/permease subunit